MASTEELLGELSEEQTAEERMKRMNANHRREMARLMKMIDNLEQKCDLLTSVDEVDTAGAPAWLAPKKPTKAHRGIANLMLSDLHLDEVVKPAEVAGVNAFSRRIALLRLQRTFEKFIVVARDYVNGISYDGAHIWMNGDTFSGNIHEELRITNEVPIMASVDYWVDPMVAGLKMIADEFGKLHLSGRVGNHGRNTMKPIYKGRVEDNFDWLFNRILQRELQSDKRITWDLPASPDGEVITQYNTRFMATHGDQFNGGSGISGILTPLKLGDHRKSQRQLAVDAPYDYMLIGHFHQYMSLPRIIVNGSLKGYDEYAYGHNFAFEQPKQAFWVTTPEHGVSFSVALQPMDRKSEKW